MKRSSSVFGALLVFGLVGGLSAPASAGGYGDRYGDNGRYHSNDCNCDGPVVRVVNAGTQVVTSHRTINTNRVVPHVRVVDKNRVIVHQRTILHRNIVTHRHNTEHRKILVRRINTAHKFRTVHKHQTVHRRVNTNTKSHAVKTVRGRDCNCAPGQPGYRGMSYWRKHGQVAVRN